MFPRTLTRSLLALAAAAPLAAASPSLAASHHHGAHGAHAPAAATPAKATAAGAHRAHAAGGVAMTFEVGTAAKPLITRGPRGPLWRATKLTAPGTTKHGTFAQLAVAAKLEELRQPASAPADGGRSTEALAGRTAVLTTAQATKQLSKRCQKLLKTRKSKLRKADRKRREDCIAKRRKLVEASKRPAGPSTPGVPAPTAPIQGPAPTTAPPATTPEGGAPSTPAPTTPAPTTPTTPSKKYAAVGVKATEGADPFGLTRGTATADIVNFELDNVDSQAHDLWIAPANAAGDVTGALVKIIGRIDGGTRQSADVELAPGRYKLICTVPGHGPMAVNFTVYAPTPA